MKDKITLYTTLNEIIRHGPCSGGWLQERGKWAAQIDPNSKIDLLTILNNSAVEDAIWVLRAALPVKHRDLIARLFACDCAEKALALVPDPDPRSIEAVRVSRGFANGVNTQEELAAARDAANVTGAEGAAWAAAGAAAWAWQEKILRYYLEEFEGGSGL